ncbi:GGDEF domain-containing protein [Pseudonocardia pini]|uniref:GGDEF domain-containing protein n=1 Tax=Pseudonocardia pini TaxID=2758030 RepID=UPI0015F11118|nr:GGDEF domain-containing protein [Pseudonocardia pini]
MALVGSAWATLRPSFGALLLAVLLAAAGIVHTEVATGVERARRRVGEKSYTDLSTIWTFAAALLLPAALATATIVVIYTYLWFRVWKPARFPLFRHTFTTTTVLLAAVAAQEVVTGTGGTAAWSDGVFGIASLGAATLVYAAVNSLLIALAVAVSTPDATPSHLFGALDEITVELATLCLGAMLALTLTVSWWFVLFAFVPVLVLQRAVMYRELAAAATTDGKTGLLTATAWNAKASEAIDRARREQSTLAMLVLDLDHFKRVNDTHGHIAGDRVLAAVADAVRAEVRGDDLVGRFGGEEFVVLLPGLPTPRAAVELHAVAERIRVRVTTLAVPVETPDGPLTISDLSISVGGSVVSSAPGTTVEQAMTVADRELYRAKDSGRNAVRIAQHHDIPAPRTEQQPRIVDQQPDS